MRRRARFSHLLILFCLIFCDSLNAGFLSDFISPASQAISNVDKKSDQEAKAPKVLENRKALQDLQNVYKTSFHESIAKSKKVLQAEVIPHSTDTAPIYLYFYGYSIDEDLGVFYDLLSSLENPAILNPVAVNKELITSRCLTSGAKSINTGLTYRDSDWVDRDPITLLLNIRSEYIPKEMGGEIKYGISEKAYYSWKSKIQEDPASSLKEIEQKEAYHFYEQNYLEDPGYKLIESPGLKAKIFESAVIHGNEQTIKWLQRTLSFAEDGILTNSTLKLINSMEPVELQQEFDLIRRNSLDCDNLEKIAIEYGLFVSAVPPSFYKLYRSLKEIYGSSVVPGIKWTPYESVVMSYIDSNLSGNVNCKEYRFDNRKDCVLRKKENYYFIRTQGLRTKLSVPIGMLDNFTSLFSEAFENRDSYKFGRVGFSIGDSLEKHGYRGIEMDKLSCDSLQTISTGTVSFDSLNEIKDHVNQYLDFYYEGEEWKDSDELDYPYVVFIDEILLDKNGEQIRHPDLLSSDKASVQEKTQNCIVSKKSSTGHGVFSQGILLAKPNGKGVIGLVPKLPDDLVDIQDAPDPVTLRETISTISQLVQEEPEYDRMVVNVSSDVPYSGDIESEFYKTLKASILLSEENILWVVSAGNRGESFVQNCNYLPTCLGDLPNVITVSAIDRIVETEIIKLWPGSNRGGEVSVAAPGIGIVSTDLIEEKPSLSASFRPVYGIRDGTSFSAAFTTALAIQLWAKYDHLSAPQVKDRIVSTAQPILKSTENEMIHFGGRKQEVQAGAIHPKLALENPTKALVVLDDGSEIYGKIKPQRRQNAFVLFSTRLSSKEDPDYICRMRDLRRIIKYRDKYRMVCSKKDKSFSKFSYIEGVLESKRAKAMPCITHKNCFKLIKDDGSKIFIDIKKIREIYFPVS